MNRGWFLLLAASIGLNAGLFYVHLTRPETPTMPQERRIRMRLDDDAPPPMDEMMARHRERMANRLGLDEAQRERLVSIHERLAPEIARRRQTMFTLRQEIADAFADGAVDAEKVRDLTRQISVQQAELDSVVAETLISEAGLLSPEQRQMFLDVLPFVRGPKGPGPQGFRGRRPLDHPR